MEGIASIQIVRMEEPEDETAWDRYVSERPEATGYHHSAWRHVIAGAFGHPTFYYMARGEQGAVKGVLPLVYLSSRVFGKFFVSLPYVNYGGVLADSPEVRDALVAAAVTGARDSGASHIELRQEINSELGLPKKDHKVSMRLELPQRFDDLMKAFPPKLRSQMRRGEKEGMTVRIGGIELLDDFYQIFSVNMRDLGTPVHGKKWFARILQTFPKDSNVCSVYLGRKVLAAGLVYGFRRTLEIPWASSDKSFARLAPNMLLYGSILKYACEQGYQCFDFGRSTKDSGTYRFKEQWGAKPVQLHWYYWLRDGQTLPELNPQNPKYRLAIEAWKRLPLPLTTMLGPRISKYLP